MIDSIKEEIKYYSKFFPNQDFGLKIEKITNLLKDQTKLELIRNNLMILKNEYLNQKINPYFLTYLLKNQIYKKHILIYKLKSCDRKNKKQLIHDIPNINKLSKNTFIKTNKDFTEFEILSFEEVFNELIEWVNWRNYLLVNK
ncbi:hypothetical protein [[Mycoplasma] anseris]|uniref:Uncharacterized protein n=1 Tax=[Mycoplasma] anseris TaxID=92400 RepID=A0A2Z4NDS2_9BACT|nr:hypothetical protein [[Mycoplasma] anseris]AWX69555.1 hypothetical protein DP065_02205 [[Mycoplasma] anseris]